MQGEQCSQGSRGLWAALFPGEGGSPSEAADSLGWCVQKVAGVQQPHGAAGGLENASLQPELPPASKISAQTQYT